MVSDGGYVILDWTTRASALVYWKQVKDQMGPS